jgi:hypothetical protein
LQWHWHTSERCANAKLKCHGIIGVGHHHGNVARVVWKPPQRIPKEFDCEGSQKQTPKTKTQTKKRENPRFHRCFEKEAVGRKRTLKTDHFPAEDKHKDTPFEAGLSTIGKTKENEWFCRFHALRKAGLSADRRMKKTVENKRAFSTDNFSPFRGMEVGGGKGAANRAPAKASRVRAGRLETAAPRPG